MPATITPDEFGALVADVRGELDAARAETRARILARPRQEDPKAFALYPAARRIVPRDQAAEVTGYAQESLKVFRWRAERARAEGRETHRHMPAEAGGGGGWEAGALAIWMATRDVARGAELLADDAKAAAILADYAARAGMRKGETIAAGLTNADIAARHGVSVRLAREIGSGRGGIRRGPLGARLERREKELKPAVRAIGRRDGEVTYAAVAAELGIDPVTAKSIVDELGIPLRRKAPDGEVAAFIAAVLNGPGQHKTAAKIYRRARAEGVKASPRQVARLLPRIRADVMAQRQTPAGQGRARGESLRADGLLTSAELAADWGVSRTAITAARRRGDITPAKWDGGKPLWDGANMRSRSDARTARNMTPVDKGHPMAVPLPGDDRA